jgi:glutamate formiminotransferase
MKDFENQFLSSDVEMAKREKACGTYLLERIALEFKHGNFELMENAAEELVRTAKHLEELRQRKLEHDRFVKPIFVKVYPLNPITIQECLRGIHNE